MQNIDYLKNLTGYLNAQKIQPRVEISHTGIYHCEFCDIDTKNLSSHKRTKKHIVRNSEYIIGKARKAYYDYNNSVMDETEREKWNNYLEKQCIESLNNINTGERIITYNYLHENSIF